MRRMGRKQIAVHLSAPVAAVPASLAAYDLAVEADGRTLVYTYDTRGTRTGITALLADIAAAGLTLGDVETRQSSLEDIFVDLVAERAAMP